MAFRATLSLTLLLLPFCLGATVDVACRHLTSFKHRSVPLPFSNPVNARVPLHLHFACDSHRRAIGRNRPLLLLVPGAFVLAEEYSRLGDALARRGFVVAIPQYGSRSIGTVFGVNPFFAQHIKTLKGLKCPKKLPFPTTAVVAMSYSVRKTVIFGHSAGGAAAQLLFTDDCDALKRPIVPPPENFLDRPDVAGRFICEQVRGMPKKVKILGLVSYEGHNEQTPGIIPSKIPYVAIDSMFNVETSSKIFNGKNFGGLLAKVLVRKANHFGPNDFFPSNENQKALCAVARRPPEASFTTTRCMQHRVIQTVARITLAAYRSFERKDGFKPILGLLEKKKLLVEKVKIQ